MASAGAGADDNNDEYMREVPAEYGGALEQERFPDEEYMDEENGLGHYHPQFGASCSAAAASS